MKARPLVELSLTTPYDLRSLYEIVDQLVEKNQLVENDLQESLFFIRKRISFKPTVAVILGSGLGDFASRLEKKVTLLIEDIPCYPHPTVEGHSGKLIFGKIGSTNVLAFQGRIHYYEVGDLSKVLFPIRIAHGLEVKKLLVTNAAGGVNRQFQPADLMLITDQINLTFENPLTNVSKHRSSEAKLSFYRELYDSKFQRIIEQVAAEKSIPLRRGVYCGVKGPSYETAAEIQLIRRIGGDAVGMSTVNEVSLAVDLGMRVAGISCITNFATGITSSALSHGEVTEVAHRVKKRFAALLSGVIEKL